MDVKITGDEASGFGPSGPVELTVADQDGNTVVSGTWNGGPVHLALAPDSLKGSVILRPGRSLGSEQSCGYELRVRAGSALVGSSSCGGMPQDTRLEVDPRLRAMMTPTEMVVVLVATLANPPSLGEWH
jgi:hypothetical protein